MSSPVIPVACFLLVIWGFVLLFQGAVRRDPSDFGWMEAQQHFNDDYQGMRHGQEQHPWRLTAIGGGLVLVGIGLIVVWGAIWG